ncbi:MAG: acyl-CoA desaturase [Vicinamibacterales bacterium]|jgi:stearoyl-CoA desaturase (delta-9 desaturase)
MNGTRDGLVVLKGRALRMWRSVLTAVVLIPILGTITASVTIIRWGIEPRHVWLAAGLYLITALGVTAGYHRLFAHNSFATSTPTRLLLGVAGSMAVQGPILGWVADHRLHHQHSDGPGDLHSPAFGRQPGLRGFCASLAHAQCGWFFTGWRASGRYANDLYRDSVIRFVDRNYVWWIGLSLASPGLIDWLIARDPFAAGQAVLVAGFSRIFALQHVTWAVNSVGHSFGRRSFETVDHSRNNAVLGVLALGEGWHNNHHAVPHSARHGMTAWQLDVTWLLIRALEALGLAWDVQRPRTQQ